MTSLAIDQGTTSTRALLVSEDGVRLLKSLPHRQIYPAPGWVEHDPEELLANLAACLEAGKGIASVGLANQGESCLAWDAVTLKPLTPVIVWQDNRTAETCARLAAEGHEALVRAKTGLPIDPYFSASKLGWIMQNLPGAQDLLAQGRLRLGTTDAFFRARLTGKGATDLTTASRTSLLDLASGTWDAELCQIFGVPIEALPPILPSTGDLGDLGHGQRLTASVVDQQAALYGHGIRKRGDAKITFGTGAFVLCLTEGLETPATVLPTVAWAKAGQAASYAVEGGVYAASSAVNWARELGLFSDLNELNHFDAPPAISRGLAFVPALAGLAAPHWDRAARGAWLGMTLETKPQDLMQALLEGVAFRAAEVLEAMADYLSPDTVISIDGGMSRNPWFCQFLSDVLGRPLRISDEAELTALGTGLLAAEGAGHALDLPISGRIITPRPIPQLWRDQFRLAREAVQGYRQITC